jgi:hypothetical protein
MSPPQRLAVHHKVLELPLELPLESYRILQPKGRILKRAKIQQTLLRPIAAGIAVDAVVR